MKSNATKRDFNTGTI